MDTTTDTLLLDRYHPLQRLGSGGQAEVFLAFDEQMKRRVAIKRVALHDAYARLAAIEEVRTAAMLNHTNIVTMYDFAHTDEAVYLIMEHIDGITLADIASEDLTDEIIAAVVRDVSDALIFAHKNGVLHLDIKPANLIINREGIVKIIDFGVSALSHATNTSTATAGTIGYMPLEQLIGADVTPATDQWALAAVIYELLSDEFPYEEQFSAVRRTRRTPDELTLMTRLQSADEPNLIQTSNDAFNDAIARALTRRPEQRFASIKELRGALLDALPAPRIGRGQLKKIVAALKDDDITESSDTTPSIRARPLAGCFSILALPILVALGFRVASFLLQ